MGFFEDLAKGLQDVGTSVAAGASAALPVVVALAPLCLGPIAVFGTPPFLEQTIKFLKSLGWLK